MFKPIEIFIGLRYTRAKQRSGFISFISMTSMLGVALGVMALITVLSVMNGFEAQLREKILGMASHVTVSEHRNALDTWQQLGGDLIGNEEIIGWAPFVRAEVMLSANGRVSGSLLRGVLPEKEGEVSDIAEKMIEGNLSEGEKIYNNDVEIGKVLINKKYPFALIKFLDKNFDKNQTFKCKDGLIKIFIPEWINI